jgi:hypothetical protein
MKIANRKLRTGIRDESIGGAHILSIGCLTSSNQQTSCSAIRNGGSL